MSAPCGSIRIPKVSEVHRHSASRAARSPSSSRTKERRPLIRWRSEVIWLPTRERACSIALRMASGRPSVLAPVIC
ncbi:hypothetical protein [Streptomyces sp. NPDC005181]|uniref:hypothetical protein n=1 Tax=Streptomyces sp. NPDC005181 TaxID=3156869 RepID=UPI0033AC59FF